MSTTGRRACAAAATMGGLAIVAIAAFAEPTGLLDSASDGAVYAVIGAMAFLETGVPLVSALVPGELTVAFGGTLLAAGRLDAVTLGTVVWGSSLAGDWGSFLAGRSLGPRFLLTHGARVGLTHARVRRLEAHYARYGAASVVVARFVPVVRALAPFTAGAAGLTRRRFAGWDLLGTGLFTVVFISAGYASFDAYQAVADRLSTVVMVVIAAALVALLLQLARRRRGRAAAPQRPRSCPNSPPERRCSM